MQNEDSDDNDDNRIQPTSFGQRHATAIMTVVLASLMIITIVVQVGC